MGISLSPSRNEPLISPVLRARRRQDRAAARGCFIFVLFPLLFILLIAGLLIWRSWPILKQVGWSELLLGQTWKPLQGKFGFFPFIASTLWVTLTSVVLATPPSLLTAIYLAEYAHPRTQTLLKPALDLLAAIPSVVYGVWGLIAIVPLIQNTLAPFLKQRLGFLPIFQSENPTGFSILAGAIVLAVMIAPFIIVITYEVMRNVPEGMRQASLAIGATRWQTIRHVVLPKSATGILAGIGLGLSRALGETMAVLMVVGNVVQVPRSLLDAAYPLPALIANNYGEMMSIPLYDAALMNAALILLVVVLGFNLISTLLLRHVRERAL